MRYICMKSCVLCRISVARLGKPPLRGEQINLTTESNDEQKP